VNKDSLASLALVGDPLMDDYDCIGAAWWFKRGRLFSLHKKRSIHDHDPGIFMVVEKEMFSMTFKFTTTKSFT
jgi:hypothetical protein